MERCVSCGASLSPDISWCGQCFATKASMVGASSEYRRPLRPTDLIPEPASGRERLVVVPDLDPPRRSVWRPRATGFGLLGRLITTAVLLSIGLGLWIALSVVLNEGTTALLGLRMVIAGLYVVLAGLLLVSIWRPRPAVNAAAFDRPPRIVRVDGPGVEPRRSPTRPDFV